MGRKKECFSFRGSANTGKVKFQPQIRLKNQMESIKVSSRLKVRQESSFRWMHSCEIDFPKKSQKVKNFEEKKSVEKVFP